MKKGSVIKFFYGLVTIMKKKSIALIIILSLLGLGILLTITGIAMGGTLRTFSVSPEKTAKGVSHELKDISLTDDTDIQKLDLNLSAHSVKIRKGNSFSVEGGTLSENKVENGTWHVKTILSNHAVNLFGFHLPLPIYQNYEDNDVTITIPENVTLQEADFDLAAADVNIESLNCNVINLKLSAGSLRINDINAQTLNTSVSAGSIQIEQYHITQEASLSGKMADIKLGSDDNDTQNLCNNLKASCTMGDIKIYGKLTGENTLDCTMGDIKANLTGTKYNYDIVSSSSTLGSVSHDNDKKSGTKTDTPLFGTLDLDCTMGDIKISYQ